jgi:ribosomal protein S20
VLGYEAPLVGKKRGRVKSFLKNFETNTQSHDERKIQDAIAKLLPQVNLILPARKPGR